MTLYKFRQSLTATEPLAASRIDARTRRVFVGRQGRLGAGARVCSAGGGIEGGSSENSCLNWLKGLGLSIDDSDLLVIARNVTRTRHGRPGVATQVHCDISTKSG
jgi:hypothetical protein